MKIPAKNQHSTSGTQRGLSLVELMIALIILGFMALICINVFGGAGEAARDQKDKRNAQEIASVAAIASAAGAQFVIPGDEKATIEHLRDGCTPTGGAFKGRLFRLPSLGEAEITGAMRYLALNDTELQYHVDGSAGR